MSGFLLIADVVWPALDLAGSLWTWWVVLAGLLVEWPLAWLATKRSLLVGLLADLAMNAASAVAGGILLAIAGLAWEVGPGQLVMGLTDWGTYNPVTWWATFALAVLINSVIEAAVLVRFRAPSARRSFLLLLPGNAISVLLAAWHIRDGLHGL